jgi:beta-1,4-mannosyl-glycoprotein beta-1,4-N-acetylglucosaminyltransferase
MVVDGFILFNELDLLEIRLHELWDVVDRFVIVEAPVTHTNKPKPLYYQTHQQRFARFQSKIVYVVVDDMPQGGDNWAREYHQRNCMVRGLEGCQEGDTILLSDVDEIPDARTIRSHPVPSTPHVLRQEYCYYFLNLSGGKWNGTILCRYNDLVGRTVQSWRDLRNELPAIQDGGWHFSFIGGPERVIEKLEAYTHQEFNTKTVKDERRILYSMITGRDLFGRNRHFRLVDVDKLPRFVQDNLALCQPFLAAPPPETPGFTEDWYPAEQQRWLERLARRVRHLNGAVIEVGCWEGRSTVMLANTVYPDDVLAVDTWAGNQAEDTDHVSVLAVGQRDILAKFASNVRHMTGNNVVPFIMTSAAFFARFDAPIRFCHIDASHDYESVCTDIDGALRRLVCGGILCGDDFENANIRREDLKGGVERAVRERLPGFRTAGNFWYWQKGCGWKPKVWLRRAASHMPRIVTESRLGRELMPKAWSVPADEVLQMMD